MGAWGRSAHGQGGVLTICAENLGTGLLFLNIKASPETLMVRRLNFIKVLNLCVFEQPRWGRHRGHRSLILKQTESNFLLCWLSAWLPIIPSRVGRISMTLKLIFGAESVLCLEILGALLWSQCHCLGWEVRRSEVKSQFFVQLGNHGQPCRHSLP